MFRLVSIIHRIAVPLGKGKDMHRVTLAGALALCALAGSAQAAIFTTYQDPAGDREFKYTAPAGNDPYGKIAINTAINFQVDLTEEGLGVMTFPGATITKSADVSTADAIIPGVIHIAEVFNADFEIRDAANNLIIAGEYGNTSQKPWGADLTLLGTSATLNANATAAGGSLVYSLGPALSNALAGGGLALGASVDAVWTVTALTSNQINNTGFLKTFEANSAFTGTFEVVPVPTPGAVSLLAAAGAVGLRRRRRN